mgnify:CR=1 FL=1
MNDVGFRGVVISLGHANFSQIQIDGELVQCGSVAKLKAVSVEARKNSVAGLEFLEGIPGNVGGALRMNAGAMGGETFRQVVSVRFVDSRGEFHTRTPAELEVRYRDVPALANNYAVNATFCGEPAAAADIAARLVTIRDLQKSLASHRDEIRHELLTAFRPPVQEIAASAGIQVSEDRNAPVAVVMAARGALADGQTRRSHHAGPTPTASAPDPRFPRRRGPRPRRGKQPVPRPKLEDAHRTFHRPR